MTVATGALIAQIIPLAALPLLVRIYSPEDMGNFAFFSSIVLMLGTITSGRYEMAIMLATVESEVSGLIKLCLLISFILNLFTLFILIAWGGSFIYEEIIWVPLAVFLSGSYQALRYAHNNKKNYKIMSLSAQIQSFVTVIMSISIGFFISGKFGLVIGYVIGLLFAVIYLAKCIYREISPLEWTDHKNITLVAKKYNQFPKNQVISSFINIGAKELPKILIKYLIGPAELGFFYLSQRILAAPVTLISGSINEVFFGEAARLRSQKKNLLKLFDATGKKLFIFGLLPCVAIILYGENIFEYILGPEWKITGRVIQALMPFYFIYFITAPLNSIFFVFERHGLQLAWQLLFFTMSVFSIIISYLLSFDIVKLSYCFSIANGFVFIVSYLICRKICKC